jgi:hypothetical protein
MFKKVTIIMVVLLSTNLFATYVTGAGSTSDKAVKNAEKTIKKLCKKEGGIRVQNIDDGPYKGEDGVWKVDYYYECNNW